MRTDSDSEPLLTAPKPAGASPGSPRLPAGQLPKGAGFNPNPLANENGAVHHSAAWSVGRASSRISPKRPDSTSPSSAWIGDPRISYAWLLLAASLFGCGTGDPVPTAYVEGTVLLDDAPLANAEVNFLGSGYAGITKTDAEGAFKLKAQVGKNIVYFSKYESEVDPTLTVGMEGKSAKFLPKQLVPKKYTTDKSEIKDDVPRGGQRGVEFRLKSP